MRAAVSGLSPLVPRIAADLGLSTGAFGVLGMVPTAAFAVSAFLAPQVLRHVTVPRALAGAMMLTGASQVFRVWGPSALNLFLGSVLALLAIGISNALMPLAVRQFFPNRVSILSTIYMLSMQVGMMTAPIVAEPLALFFEGRGATHTWTLSLGSWSVFAFAAALAWLPLIDVHFNPRRRAKIRPVTATKPVAKMLPVWKTPVGWGLMASFGASSFATYAIVMFLPAIFVAGGASLQFGANMLALWSGIGLILSFIGPWAAARFRDPLWVIIFFYVGWVVGNMGMVFAPMKLPILWTILSGLGPASFPISLTLVNIRARTMAGAAALSSFGQGAGYTFACLGPLLFGLVFDLTGGYFWPMMIIVAALVLGSIGSFFVTRNVYVEDQL